MANFEAVHPDGRGDTANCRGVRGHVRYRDMTRKCRQCVSCFEFVEIDIMSKEFPKIGIVSADTGHAKIGIMSPDIETSSEEDSPGLRKHEIRHIMLRGLKLAG